MYIGDNSILGKVVAETAREEGIHINSCGTGNAALKVLNGDGVFDLVIVDNELLNGGGLELVLRIRRLRRRRSVRILMIAQDDCEREAWRAGVSAFLRKEKIDELPSAIERLLKENEER
jgi:CheY-like chemotaxis protein